MCRINSEFITQRLFVYKAMTLKTRPDARYREKLSVSDGEFLCQ